MAAKKTKGILVYNLLVHEVTAINNLLPENRKLSLFERRQLISKVVYPRYKGQAKRNIRLKPLRKLFYKEIKKLPKKIGCDILSIDTNTYREIPYYEVESLIDNILPKCIYVRVDAADFGDTAIFYTGNFDYYKSGIAKITNDINEEVRRQKTGSSYEVVYYIGKIKLQPKKDNNGIPENYYLELTLHGMGTSPVKKETPLSIPKRKKTKRQEKQEDNIRQYVRERLKTLKAQKSVNKKIRKRIGSKYKSYRNALKEPALSKDIKKEMARQFYESEKKQLDKALKENILTQKKYDILLKDLKHLFHQ